MPDEFSVPDVRLELSAIQREQHELRTRLERLGQRVALLQNRLESSAAAGNGYSLWREPIGKPRRPSRRSTALRRGERTSLPERRPRLLVRPPAIVGIDLDPVRATTNLSTDDLHDLLNAGRFLRSLRSARRSYG